MTGRERDRFDRRELVGEGAFGSCMPALTGAITIKR